MGRCGVEPGEPALALARQIAAEPGPAFVGLQGYDGHLQLLPDPAETAAKCLQGLEQLVGTRRLIEKAGIPVEVVTGAGTGTWEFVGRYAGMTEIQPGSFVLMDCAYHPVRPEFGCSLSILATVISRRPGWYVLDAGSKAISQGLRHAGHQGPADEQVIRLSEEHANVEAAEAPVQVGDRREVIPAHCCATMNLHRQCVAVRRRLRRRSGPRRAARQPRRRVRRGRARPAPHPHARSPAERRARRPPPDRRGRHRAALGPALPEPRCDGGEPAPNP